MNRNFLVLCLVVFGLAGSIFQTKAATYEGFLVRSVRVQTRKTFANGTPSQPAGPTRLFRYFITDAQIQASPPWSSEEGVEPPLSRAAAIQTAAEAMHRRFADLPSPTVHTCSLQHLVHPGTLDRWYYLVEFVPPSIRKDREDYVVMMLLDGTIIEPRVTVTNS